MVNTLPLHTECFAHANTFSKTKKNLLNPSPRYPLTPEELTNTT